MPKSASKSRLQGAASTSGAPPATPRTTRSGELQSEEYEKDGSKDASPSDHVEIDPAANAPVVKDFISQVIEEMGMINEEVIQSDDHSGKPGATRQLWGIGEDEEFEGSGWETSPRYEEAFTTPEDRGESSKHVTRDRPEEVKHPAEKGKSAEGTSQDERLSWISDLLEQAKLPKETKKVALVLDICEQMDKLDAIAFDAVAESIHKDFYKKTPLDIICEMAMFYERGVRSVSSETLKRVASLNLETSTKLSNHTKNISETISGALNQLSGMKKEVDASLKKATEFLIHQESVQSVQPPLLPERQMISPLNLTPQSKTLADYKGYQVLYNISQDAIQCPTLPISMNPEFSQIIQTASAFFGPNQRSNYIQTQGLQNFIRLGIQ